MLTAYGIETIKATDLISLPFFSNVATVLTAYGIETFCFVPECCVHFPVATVLTAYGIET